MDPLVACEVLEAEVSTIRAAYALSEIKEYIEWFQKEGLKGRQLFSWSALEKAIASKEEMEEAKREGEYFSFRDGDVEVRGYYFNDTSYITEIEYL